MKFIISFTKKELEDYSKYLEEGKNTCKAINCFEIGHCPDCPLYDLDPEEGKEYIEKHLEQEEEEDAT